MVEPVDLSAVDFTLVTEMRSRLMRAVSEPGRNQVTGAIEPNPIESMTALMSVTAVAIAAKAYPLRGGARRETVAAYLRTIKKHVAEMLVAFDSDDADPEELGDDNG